MKAFVEGEIGNSRYRSLRKQVSLPKTLKIGVDVGATLTRFAKYFPEKFFVGIEIKPERAQEAAHRLTREKIDNALVINIEALRYLREFAGEERFEEIYVFFPTPYPNSLKGYPHRLTKRLINKEFESHAYNAVVPGGSVRIITDHGRYFEHIQTVFPEDRWWPVQWRRIDIGQGASHLVGTRCEIDFRKKGQVIFYVQLVRK